MQNAAQLRILKLKEYLYQHTDEQHPATAVEIIAYLESCGLGVARKTLYADIDTLVEAGEDIVVIKSRQNRYFAGNRLFEVPELKLLVDAIAASKSVSRKKTQQIIEKLCTLSSKWQTAQICMNTDIPSRIKSDNDMILYQTDSIKTALDEKRQLSFQYYAYAPNKKKVLKHGGLIYIVNPYAMICKNDNYYLIGFSHKHGKIAHFRVDRIHKPEVLKEHFEPPEDFDAASYSNKMLEMFANEQITRVKLLCDNEMMKVIVDAYGEDTHTEQVNDEQFAAYVDVAVSPIFYGWVFNFDGRIQIMEPTECVNTICEMAAKYVVTGHE